MSATSQPGKSAAEYDDFLFWRQEYHGSDLLDVPDAEDENGNDDEDDEDDDEDLSEGEDEVGDEFRRVVELEISKMMLNDRSSSDQFGKNDSGGSDEDVVDERRTTDVSVVFNDYNHWKVALLTDIDIPDLSDDETDDEGRERDQSATKVSYDDDGDDNGDDDDDEQAGGEDDDNNQKGSIIHGHSLPQYSKRELDEIDRNSLRLDIFMIFFHDFSSEYGALARLVRERLMTVGLASQEILQSEKLPILFGVVMTLTKRLQDQGQGPPSAAPSFRIGQVEEILTRKSNDGETSLLHYVSHVLDQNDQNTPTLSDELSKAHKAKEVDMAYLTDRVGHLKRGLEAIRSELGFQCKTADDSYDFRIRLMQEFMGSYGKEFPELEEAMQSTEQIYQMALSFLGEDPSVSPAVFFSQVSSVVLALERASEDNRGKKRFSKSL